MNKIAVRHRIQTIFLTVLILVLLSMLLLGLRYLWVDQRDAILQHEVQRLDSTVQGLLSGLETIMLTGEGYYVKDWTRRISRQPDFLTVQIIGNDGAEAFRDTKTVTRVNAYLGFKRFSRSALAPSPVNDIPQDSLRKALDGHPVRLFDPDGNHLTFLQPIINGPSCRECHGYESEATLGIMRATVSLVSLEKHISDARRQSFLLTSVTAVLVAGALIFMVRRYILIPIAAVRKTTGDLAAGMLDARVVVYRKDEIGALAASINEMARQLRTTMVSRDHLAGIMTAMFDALFVASPQGVIRSANKAACGLLGYSEEELTGKQLATLFADPHFADECLLKNIVEGSFDGNREAELIAKTGKPIPVFFSASLMHGPLAEIEGLVCVARDISTLKQTQDALRKSEESFHSIVEKTPDGILIVDSEGTVRYANRSAEALLNRRVEEIVDLPFGFPVIAESVTELDTIRPGIGHGVAEMRMMETRWQGADSFLVSLRDVTENVQLREQLRHLSISDELTGLYNRRGFVSIAEQQMKIARRTGQLLHLFFLDLDGMKEVNDNLGHDKGDLMLVETAKLLQATFRESDVIAQVGGDEFFVLGMETADHGKNLMVSRLRKAIELFNNSEARHFTLSVSAGIATFDPAEPCMLQDLVMKADQEMYEEKRKKIRRGATADAGGQWTGKLDPDDQALSGEKF